MVSKRLRSMLSGAEAPGKLVEENAVKGKSKITDDNFLQKNPGSLEKLTVQQLRLKLRSLGVPAKGSKSDLLSALKNFSENKVDDELSQEDDKVTSLGLEKSDSNVNSKRNARGSSGSKEVQNMSALSENHVLKRTKRIVEEDRITGTRSTVHKGKQLSAVTNEDSGKKPKQAKRKVGLDSDCVDLVASDTAVLSENLGEPWTILAHKKPQKEWIPYSPRTMRPPPPSSDFKYVKLMSWNVNGLRALLKMEGFSALELAQRENFDVLCLQETKLQEKDVEAIKETLLEGYGNSFWTCSASKLGYSGTAIISRIKPLTVRYGLDVADHDSEGRLVTAEFDSFYLLSGYVPNSGDGLKRLQYRVGEWDPALASYMKELEKSKPVILTGDLNCAHQEIDIYNPAGNKRSAGFTIEERRSFETNFLNNGFVDTFRKQHPGVIAYTYWGYRHGGRQTNKGWRLDYFLVSETISDKVHDSYILPDITGSDHCPIGLILML